MTSATGVEPMARKAAYHQISDVCRSALGMPASALAENVMTSPRTSNGCRPVAQNGPRSAAAGGVAISSSSLFSGQRSVSWSWNRARTVGVNRYSKTWMPTKDQITDEWTAFATPSAPPLAPTPLAMQMAATIAPKTMHLTSPPTTSTTVPCVKKLARKPPALTPTTYTPTTYEPSMVKTIIGKL